MFSRNRCCPRPAILLILALLLSAPAAWAGNAKVKVCHIPPGNPGNFHTITVSENALQAHLGHGDLAGACFAHCDTLCDDGNACTIDACNASEQCLNTHPPVNCDDGLLCTTDSCNPASGCASVPKTCTDGDNCTVNACDPVTGSCVAPPVSCPVGQSCNPGDGSCASAEVTCPCIAGLPGFLEISNAPVLACYDVTSGFLTLKTAPPEGQFVQDLGVVLGGSPNCSINSDPFLSVTLAEAQACIDYLRAKAAAAGVPCEIVIGY